MRQCVNASETMRQRQCVRDNIWHILVFNLIKNKLLIDMTDVNSEFFLGSLPEGFFIANRVIAIEIFTHHLPILGLS